MSATERRAWLDEALAGYAARLRWVIEHKDFNAFWPVGLPRAGTAMGDALVAPVEDAIAAGALRRTVPNPTAALLLLFFSTYGMRTAGWPRERRLRYAEALLGLVRASKRSPVVDEHGRHQLVDVPEPPDDAWHDGLVRDVSVFCALSWATAEALYFCNHRVGTERHGPYPTCDGDGTRMVRTVYDLRPVTLWPEVDAWPQLPARVDVVFDYAWGEARFDLFANPLFDFDSAGATRRVAVLARSADGRARTVRELDEVREWNAALRCLVATVAPRVEAMAERDRIARLHAIMLYSAARLTEPPLAGSPGLPPGDGVEVRGSLDELARYYDLRCDAP